MRDIRNLKAPFYLLYPSFFILCWMWSALAVLRELVKFNEVAEECTSQLRPGFHGTTQDYTESMRCCKADALIP